MLDLLQSKPIDFRRRIAGIADWNAHLFKPQQVSPVFLSLGFGKPQFSCWHFPSSLRSQETITKTSIISITCINHLERAAFSWLQSGQLSSARCGHGKCYARANRCTPRLVSRPIKTCRPPLLVCLTILTSLNFHPLSSPPSPPLSPTD